MQSTKTMGISSQKLYRYFEPLAEGSVDLGRSFWSGRKTLAEVVFCGAVGGVGFSGANTKIVGLVNSSIRCKIASQNSPQPWGKTVANAIPRSKVVLTDSLTDYYPFASLQGIDTL